MSSWLVNDLGPKFLPSYGATIFNTGFLDLWTLMYQANGVGKKHRLLHKEGIRVEIEVVLITSTCLTPSRNQSPLTLRRLRRAIQL